MLLQKMNYFNDSGKVTCAVDITSSNEFTICGNNCIDAGKCEDDDWNIIGDYFHGTLKEVTCPNCLKIIDFIKNLK